MPGYLFRQWLVTPGQDGGPNRLGGVGHDWSSGVPDTTGTICGSFERSATGSVFRDRSARASVQSVGNSNLRLKLHTILGR